MITSLCLCYIIMISSIEYICCDLHLCKFTHGYLGDEFTLYMSCYSTAKGKPNLSVIWQHMISPKVPLIFSVNIIQLSLFYIFMLDTI